MQGRRGHWTINYYSKFYNHDFLFIDLKVFVTFILFVLGLF